MSNMDAFRVHAVPVGDIDGILRASAENDETSPPCSALEFYRGSIPILLKPLPCGDTAPTTPSESIPVNVMQFHTTMLPPNTHAGIDGGGPSESFDRLADAEQVELFGFNVVLPSLRRLEEELPSTLTAPACTSSGVTEAAADTGSSSRTLRMVPPQDAPCSALLFPSLLEGNLSPGHWKSLIRDGPMLDRIHYSYTILLHFFGWRLHNEETGEVDRHQNWRIRYEALAPTSTSMAATAISVYAVWTRTLRVLLELRMPNYVGRWLRFLLDEFRSERLLFLLPAWDEVWFPYVSDGKLLFPDVAEQLRKYRRKLDVHTSSDDDDLLFGSDAEHPTA